MNRLIPRVILLMALLSASAVQAQPVVEPEASSEQRAVAVEALLKEHDSAIAVYAKGLCCLSCSIGIRKMLKDLTFVNQARFNQGVSLDPKHQLVTIAIKNGHQYDVGAVSKAIDDAGYDPVSLFAMKKSKVQVLTLPRK